MVLVGVESLSEGAMDGVGRGTVDAGALRARLEALAAATRSPVVSIVLGLPGDDEAGFVETLDTLLAWTEPTRSGMPAAVGTVLVSLLQVYRGSALWARRESLGLRFREPGVPYLLESPRWPRGALARAKAAVVARMASFPDRLKAAEAIALVESEGGLDPWLSTRRVRALLAPLEPGARLGPWILVALGLQRDTARAHSLRLRHDGGAEVRVTLSRRGGRVCGSTETRLYAIDVRPVGANALPAGTADLVRALRDRLLAGEERAARVRKACR
jgi:hypothetical protein